MKDEPATSPMLRLVIRIEAGYYLITGLWPILHMRSYEAVTGPKTDDWLVHTVGLLAAAIGLTLAVGSRERLVNAITVMLGVIIALALLAVDVVYVAFGTLRPVYLLDAGFEVLLLLAYALIGFGGSTRVPAPTSR